MKKLFKSILILSLTLILLLQALPFAGAAENSAEREEPTRAGQFIVVRGCYIRDTASDSGTPVVWVSAGSKVTVAENTWNIGYYCYIPATYGSYSGYIYTQNICHPNKCYKVTKAAGATFYDATGATLGTLTYGTYVYYHGITVGGRYRVTVMTGSFDESLGYVNPSDLYHG